MIAFELRFKRFCAKKQSFSTFFTLGSSCNSGCAIKFALFNTKLISAFIEIICNLCPISSDHFLKFYGNDQSNGVKCSVYLL